MSMLVEILGYIFIFIVGTFLGSFLKVVADRTSTGRKFFKGRSKCEDCDEELKPKDLIPVFSFLKTKGKCAYCNAKLPVLYPISEVLTGLTLAGAAYYINVFNVPNPFIWVIFAYFVVMAGIYIVILFADIKYQIIPNKVVIPGIIFVLLIMVISLVYTGYSSYQQLVADEFGRYLLEVGYWHSQMLLLLKRLGYTVLSSIGLGLFFWLLIVVTKGKGMGGGDVKLAVLIGLFNGFPINIVAIVLAFVIGAIYSGIMMIFGKKGMKDAIPFGPFLILGSVLAFIFGQQLFSWYISLI